MLDLAATVFYAAGLMWVLLLDRLAAAGTEAYLLPGAGFFIVVGACRSMSVGGGTAMALLHHRFDVDDLKDLDPKELEVRKNAITHEIYTHSDIKAWLRKAHASPEGPAQS
jgi:hypothetical protein